MPAVSMPRPYKYGLAASRQSHTGPVISNSLTTALRSTTLSPLTLARHLKAHSDSASEDYWWCALQIRSHHHHHQWMVRCSCCEAVESSEWMCDVVRCWAQPCWVGGNDVVADDGRVPCVVSFRSRPSFVSDDTLCQHTQTVVGKQSGTGLHVSHCLMHCSSVTDIY